jgi:hypothetical protein
MVCNGQARGETPRYFLIKTDGANYELFKVCNKSSEVILFSQVFDLEYPPGSGFDLIITKSEPSVVRTGFNSDLKKIRQRQWLQITREN